MTATIAATRCRCGHLRSMHIEHGCLVAIPRNYASGPRSRRLRVPVFCTCPRFDSLAPGELAQLWAAG